MSDPLSLVRRAHNLLDSPKRAGFSSARVQDPRNIATLVTFLSLLLLGLFSLALSPVP